MAGYLRGMEEFLEANDRVLNALLSSGGDSFPNGNGRGLANGNGHGNGAAPAVGTATRPFVREVISVTAERAVVRCRLDLDEDAYLRDHTLGGRSVSHVDPDLTALAILPLTFTMEALCEAAELLAPGAELTGMRDVRGYRWIALDRQQPKLLEITAAKTPDGSIKTEVREVVDGQVDTVGLPLAEASVLFASVRAAAPAVSLPPLEGMRASNWKGKHLYDGFMFHGESLRSVARVDTFGTNGSDSVLAAVPEASLFVSRERTDFLSDGVVLDGAGQAVAYWTSDHLERGYHVFPFRLEALHVYGPPLVHPEEAHCRVDARLVGDTQTRSDIDIVDGAGTLRMRLEGWWDRRFEMPERFARFLGSPQRELLTEAWSELPPALAAVHATARSIVIPDPAFYRSHDGLWERVVAHVFLGRTEREVWAARPAATRLGWLLGRVAAKESVREHLRVRDGIDVLPADIELANDDEGRPLVRRIAGHSVLLPSLSIAHKDTCAVAAVADLEPGQGIGVDVELPRELDSAFVRGAFAEEEQVLVGSEGRKVLLGWCAKEALGKALGTGFSGSPTNVTVRGVADHTGKFDLTVSGRLAERFPQLAGLGIPVYALQMGELCLAACVCKK